MKTQMGVWIDHRKAIVVTITEEGEDTALVISKVEKQLRRAGDSPLKGSFETRRVPKDDRRQRAYTGHLNIYYDAVIACIHEADSILIFGPGEAKGELQTRLEKRSLSDRITAIETADKMTGRQIVAKVRKYFAKAAGEVVTGKRTLEENKRESDDNGRSPEIAFAASDRSQHDNN